MAPRSPQLSNVDRWLEGLGQGVGDGIVGVVGFAVVVVDDVVVVDVAVDVDVVVDDDVVGFADEVDVDEVGFCPLDVYIYHDWIVVHGGDME